MPYVRRKKTPVAQIVVASICALALVILAFFGIRHLIRSGRFESFDDRLKDLVARNSQELPKLVSRGIREDAVSAGPDHNFYFDYTLLDLDASEVTAQALSDKLRPMAVEAYRSDPRMENFRNHGEILHYRYADKTGQRIAEIVVGPKDLK